MSMDLLVKAVGGYWEAGCADAFANKPALAGKSRPLDRLPPIDLAAEDDRSGGFLHPIHTANLIQ